MSEKVRMPFGLSPRATIVNAIILLSLSQLFWVLKFTQQIPMGTDFSQATPESLNLVDNVPWYYDVPFIILAMIMALTWIEYKYEIKPGEFTWRAIRYKYIYTLIGYTLVAMVSKFIFLFIVLSFK
jgi:hypothetical protein